MDMLFTRLSAPGRTLVMEKTEEQPGISPVETMTLAEAVQIGQQKGADFIVTGRISLRENAISTNAEFIGTTEQRALITFTQNGTRPGDIITQIDKFTAQVNADIFTPGAFINAQTLQADDADEIYQHPERLPIPEIPPEKAAENKPTIRKESPTQRQPLDNH